MRRIPLTRTKYHFTFERNVNLRSVEDALVLASIAGEALGTDTPDRVTTHVLDVKRRTVAIDGRAEPGAATLRVFLALISEMFGPRAFRVVTAEDRTEQRSHRRLCRRCRADGARR